MALTKEGVTQLREYVHKMKEFATGIEEGYNGQPEDYSALMKSHFDEMSNSTDYHAWVTGTDYGKEFEQNFQTLQDVAGRLKSQFLDLVSKLESYTDMQEDINSGGGK